MAEQLIGPVPVLDDPLWRDKEHSAELSKYINEECNQLMQSLQSIGGLAVIASIKGKKDFDPEQPFDNELEHKVFWKMAFKAHGEGNITRIFSENRLLPAKPETPKAA